MFLFMILVINIISFIKNKVNLCMNINISGYDYKHICNLLDKEGGKVVQ